MTSSRITRYFRNSKKMIIAAILVLLSFSSGACDICGCSINGYHFGILPQFRKNIVGVSYSYRSFASQHLISETLYILGNRSTEYYNTIDVWGRVQVGKRLQLYAFVPVNHFIQREKGVSNKTNGLGDITLAANYVLLNTTPQRDKKIKQTLLAGGGIKLPAGRFNDAKAGEELNPSMNTGTGSVDYLAQVIYQFRYGRTGLNTDVNYRINGANKKEFRFGNRLTTAAKVFYWKDIGKKTTLLPNTGLLYEQAAKDRHHGEVQEFSGGHVLFFVAGLETYRGPLNIGATYNHPLTQNLSKNLVTLNNQFSVHANIIF